MGCKASFLISSSMLILGFTLTMWDVKCFEHGKSFNSLDSFTLTMWDVKENSHRINHFGFSFYLNYVGCKEAFCEE